MDAKGTLVTQRDEPHRFGTPQKWIGPAHEARNSDEWHQSVIQILLEVIRTSWAGLWKRERCEERRESEDV